MSDVVNIFYITGMDLSAQSRRFNLVANDMKNVDAQLIFPALMNELDPNVPATDTQKGEAVRSRVPPPMADNPAHPMADERDALANMVSVPHTQRGNIKAVNTADRCFNEGDALANMVSAAHISQDNVKVVKAVNTADRCFNEGDALANMVSAPHTHQGHVKVANMANRRLDQNPERHVPLVSLSIAAEHNRARRWRWIATILGGLLVGVLAATAWLWPSFSAPPPASPSPLALATLPPAVPLPPAIATTPPVSPLLPAIATPPPAPPPVVIAEARLLESLPHTTVSPARLLFVDILPSQAGLRVLLTLSRPVAAQLWVEGSLVRLVLPDTRLGGPLPSPGAAHRPLRSLEAMEAEGQPLTLRLLLDTPASVHLAANEQIDVVQLEIDRPADFPPTPPPRKGAARPPLSTPAAMEKGENVGKMAKVEKKGPGKATLLPPPDTSHRTGLALRQKDLPGTESSLRALLTATPAHHEARSALVSRLIADGRTDEALLLLQAGLTQSPGQIAFAIPYAHLLVDRGRETEALAVLKIAETSTAKAGYWGLRAAVETRLERPAEAVESYRQALIHEPGRGTWWVGLGLNLETQGQTQAAQEAWRRAAALPELDVTLQRFLASRLGAVSPPRQANKPVGGIPRQPATSRQTSPSDWFQ
ncbi:MAG: tetratricopeptide repeat protein [Pseudomonadota bacterium]